VTCLEADEFCCLNSRVAFSPSISVFRIVLVDKLGSLAAVMVDGSSRVFMFQSSFDVIVRILGVG
jgi:hypothetical protein